MQPDVWEFVLEHLKEHGEEMSNSPTHAVSIYVVTRDIRSLLFFSKDWCKAADLSTQSCTHMLRWI